MRTARVLMLAVAIALGVTGFALSALILAAGSVVLHLFDMEDAR